MLRSCPHHLLTSYRPLCRLFSNQKRFAELDKELTQQLASIDADMAELTSTAIAQFVQVRKVGSI